MRLQIVAWRQNCLKLSSVKEFSLKLIFLTCLENVKIFTDFFPTIIKFSN